MYKIFESIQDEVEEMTGNVKGCIPEWINGALYRNGPGMYEVGNSKYVSLVDGMAALQKFTIKNSTATYMRKFVKSEVYKKNMSANKIVVSQIGEVVTHPDPCKSIFERFFSYFIPFTSCDLDNTCVTVWTLKDRLFASTETSQIYEIDPQNMDTLERVDLKNYLMVDTASAHVHWDRDGTVHNIGNMYGKESLTCIFRLSAKEGTNADFQNGRIVGSVKCRWRFNPTYYHSFAMTENYYILFDQPLAINVFKLMTRKIRRTSLLDCFDFWPNEKVIFHILDKKTGEEVNKAFTYFTDACFVFHHCNAFEKNGEIILDVCQYIDANIFKCVDIRSFQEHNCEDTMNKLPKAKLMRYILPLNVNEKTKVDENQVRYTGSRATAVKISTHEIYCTGQRLFDQGFEFPKINYEFYNGKPYRYVYGYNMENSGFRGADLDPEKVGHYDLLNKTNMATDYIQKYCFANELLFCNIRKGTTVDAVFIKTQSSNLVKVDVESGHSLCWQEEGCYPSEPIFVAEPCAVEEDCGVVLSAINSVIEGRHAFLLVLDGKTFQEKGRVEFPDVRFVTDLHGIFKDFA